MFNLTTLHTCLRDVVGFQQPDNPDLPTLDSDLTISESGLYFQQTHPLVDLKILQAVAEEFASYEYSAYDAGTTYSLGNRVTVSGVHYEYINSTPTDGNSPPNATYWAVKDLFNTFLRNMRKQAITKVVNAYRTNRQLKEITKSQLDRLKLFDGPGRMTDKEVRQSRFVGLEIIPDTHLGLLMTIHRIGTQFDTVQASKTLYVYHSSQEAHCFTITVDIGKANGFEWHNVADASGNTLDLKYFEETHDAGGRWFVGYFEDDFIGQAITKKYDWENGPCSSCSSGDYRKYQQWSPWVKIRPFFVPADEVNGILLWDIDSNIYPTQTNFGLNLDISIKCDLTDIFCTQKDLLADAISKQFAADLAQEIIYSSRLNRLEERHRKNAMIALDTDSNGNPGISKLLKESIEALEFDFSSLGSACIPCNEEAGMIWGSI